LYINRDGKGNIINDLKCCLQLAVFGICMYGCNSMKICVTDSENYSWILSTCYCSYTCKMISLENVKNYNLLVLSSLLKFIAEFEDSNDIKLSCTMKNERNIIISEVKSLGNCHSQFKLTVSWFTWNYLLCTGGIIVFVSSRNISHSHYVYFFFSSSS
jgi:hypothetical protein